MKICICGVFGFDFLPTGGQPVKSRELYKAIENHYGSDNVSYIETLGWKKNGLLIVLNLIRAANRCDAIIMLPAKNGLLVFSYLMVILKKLYHINIYYSVIGGWLPNLTLENSSLLKRLKSFDGIWVETSTMLHSLNAQGLKNVVVIPNFKTFNRTRVEFPVSFSNKVSLNLVLFSRVMKQKGVADAIIAIREINKRYNREIYKLDIYGPVDSDFTIEFDALIQECPSNLVSYRGCANPKDANIILMGYDALLFPTLFYTEGIPGTIIDAYSAGIPVISSRWESFNDIVVEGETGFGYEFGSCQDLISVLDRISKNPDMLYRLKDNCINKAYQFSAEYAMNIISKQIVSKN